MNGKKIFMEIWNWGKELKRRNISKLHRHEGIAY